MSEATEILGLTMGVTARLENVETLLDEVSQKADDIMNNAYKEFETFLEKKGFENRMGMLCPRDDVDRLYHVTDIEWNSDEDSTALPTEVTILHKLKSSVADYLFDEYNVGVKAYKVTTEIVNVG